MGFFSGISKTITGGSDSSSNSNSSSGFSLLPSSIQNAYSGFADSLYGSGLLNGMPQMQASTGNALNTLGNLGNIDANYVTQQAQGLMGTPYDEFVINDINRQAAGENSLVNQAATLAGQQGSNRSFLQTSDVEQQRLNNIGQFRQDQYNNAINQTLGSLIPAQATGAQAALGAQDYLNSYPYQNLQNYASLLSVLPQSGGSTSTSNSSSSSTNGYGQFFN